MKRGRTSATGPQRPIGTFRREGEYWTIAYAGVVVRLRDTKGLQYLGQLLRHPGRAFPVADFGDPTTTTDLTVCVIDQGGLKLSATAPAGGTCGTRPCWSVIPGRKLKFTDNDLTPDGVQRMQAHPGGPGRGKIQVKGKGANLAVPTLGLATPVTVRLVPAAAPRAGRRPTIRTSPRTPRIPSRRNRIDRHEAPPVFCAK
jgi:hypothetical protein